MGSLLTLAVTNSICNQFYFDSCSCQLYVNLSYELMVYVTSFTLTAVLVSCMLTLAVSYNVSAFLYLKVHLLCYCDLSFLTLLE